MFKLLHMLAAIVVISAPLPGSVGAGGTAHGVQHLVDPGDNWSDLAQRVRPGDEIILMPGNHRSATLNNLHGTANRPIVIRSLNRDHPGVIKAQRVGLHLRRPRHVEIRDIMITGASVTGLQITDEGPGRDGRLWRADLLIRNVTIEKIGPIGRRNAMLLIGLEQVTIDQCHFEGWGGSAIELVACSEVTVDRCRFQGVADYSQMNAVQMRAGSDRIRITNCIMNDAGVTAVALGGSSSRDEFRLGQENRNATALHEAQRVRVTGNLIRGGHSGVAFINCDLCVVRNNSIIRPQRWVYLVLDESKDHLAATTKSTFAANLIQWKPGDIEHLSHSGSASDSAGLTLEQNLWWSTDLSETRDALGAPIGHVQFPQIMDVDPQLDERLLPTERRAATFGYSTP